MNYTISNTLGERIRLLRKQQGMSQEQLALKAEMAPSFIGEIERSAKKPSIESIEKISNALEISVSELFNYNMETFETNPTSLESKLAVTLEQCNNNERDILCKILDNILRFKEL
ncbi:MAG: helix-turn-helix domain-containing protein [Lachnospiraceae bacterium]|nr:helix-turn-helix domain-containing protein [Lachnospiraceae bacterium]